MTEKMRIQSKIAMKPMSFFRHAFAYATLGLLCGWYHILIILYPTLIIMTLRGSIIAGIIFAAFIALTYVPLPTTWWEELMHGYMYSTWREYFDFSFDIESVVGKLDPKKKYCFFEFPHSIFPVGQIISACVIKHIDPNRMICGTAADVVFNIPVMRQFFTWIGVRPAKKESIANIFEEGHNCAIMVGGIAEMYLVSAEKEAVYLNKRSNTVRLMIKEGANIVPAFFFGNTRLFNIAGASGSESFLSKLSRKLRTSIVIFYGRHYLPIPFRHPLRMVFGQIIDVKQNDNPNEEEVAELMERVKQSLRELYETKKPEWESRPLEIQ
jgi:1-acyl-sn-glycerol-3-phosphate acyltransferase